jgi:hypothetical protein
VKCSRKNRWGKEEVYKLDCSSLTKMSPPFLLSTTRPSFFSLTMDDSSEYNNVVAPPVPFRGSYSRDYEVDVRLAPNVDNFDPSKDPILSANFRCHDLLQVMREGLFWTTSNVIPERGFYEKTPENVKTHSVHRKWELAESLTSPYRRVAGWQLSLCTATLSKILPASA